MTRKVNLLYLMSYFQFLLVTELFWQHSSAKNNHTADSDSLDQIFAHIFVLNACLFYFHYNPKGTSVNSGKRT